MDLETICCKCRHASRCKSQASGRTCNLLWDKWWESGSDYYQNLSLNVGEDHYPPEREEIFRIGHPEFKQPHECPFQLEHTVNESWRERELSLDDEFDLIHNEWHGTYGYS